MIQPRCPLDPRSLHNQGFWEYRRAGARTIAKEKEEAADIIRMT